MQGYFCAVQNYTEKAELSKCFWVRVKFAVTMHFSELIKLQVGKKKNAIHYFVFYSFLE